jgi:hypothetical protein
MNSVEAPMPFSDIIDEFEYNVGVHRENARTVSKAQYRAALAADRWHYLVGLPAVVLGAVVSTSIFATIESSPSTAARIVAGLLGLAATGLASAQTFFNFSGRAKEHRAAGAQYGDVRRRCEQTLFEYRTIADPAEKIVFARQQYPELLDRLADLAATSPDVANKYWDRAQEDNRRRDAEARQRGADALSAKSQRQGERSRD